MKFISNMFSYLLEIIFSLFLLLSVFSYLYDGRLFAWTSEISNFEFIERITVLLVFYQLIVLVTLTLYDSRKRDSILSIIGVYNLALINLKYDKDFTQIKEVENKLLENKSVDYKNNEREIIETLIQYYEMYSNEQISKMEYEYYIENTLIILNHEYEYYDLAWRGSYILRIRK